MLLSNLSASWETRAGVVSVPVASPGLLWHGAGGGGGTPGALLSLELFRTCTVWARPGAECGCGQASTPAAELPTVVRAATMPRQNVASATEWPAWTWLLEGAFIPQLEADSGSGGLVLAGGWRAVLGSLALREAGELVALPGLPHLL